MSQNLGISMKKIAYALIFLIALLAAGIQLSGHGYFWKALASTYLQGHSTAYIDDADNFAKRTIAAGPASQWPHDLRYNQKALDPALDGYLRQYGTAAFLVAQKGALVHESYFGKYNPQSRTNSFSMAKTITTLQVQLAVQQGYISSFDAPLTERISEYAQNPWGQKATIAQLSSMKSGHDWTENYYLPLNVTTELYFGKDAEKLVLKQGFEREPGTEFEYSSGTAQLLGVFLKRALQAKEPDLTISQHLSRSLWVPLGMESEAIYTLDRESLDGGMERTYCCIFATARDFAKIGQLLLQDGQWDGKTILEKAFVERIRKPDLKPYYGHSLWMDWTYKHPFYALQGHEGQYVIVVPSLEIVVVRTGQSRDKKTKGPNGITPAEVYRFVDQAVALVQ
jgi:CubicO group peptidase (beta-lactamase class C family)